MTISINEDVESAEEVVQLLEYVSSQINQGYTSGYAPYWTLVD